MKFAATVHDIFRCKSHLKYKPRLKIAVCINKYRSKYCCAVFEPGLPDSAPLDRLSSARA